MASFRSLKGSLLVAEPTMEDPNFARSVVLVVDHTPEGAAGVILNRPTELDLTEALPMWAPHATPPRVVFLGGPVSPRSGVGIGRLAPDASVEGWEPLFGQVGVLDLGCDPAEYGSVLEGARVFLGHAGWGEGQLEGEIDQHAWFVIDPAPDDPLSPTPQRQWRTVLRRQGGTLAMVSYFPHDVSTN